MPHTPQTPCLLLILDGWGHAAPSPHNAIHQAHTPVWDDLWQHHPHSLLQASGAAVGLPEGQMGNSEVGHIHLGAGRHCPQDLVKINQAVADGTFASNPAWQDTLAYLSKNKKNLHIMGLLSPGGVHSHTQHLMAALQIASQHHDVPCYLHAFLDGRDTPPRSAKASLAAAAQQLLRHPNGHFASITGRYFAMDRDQRWERTEATYQMLTQTRAPEHTDPIVALQAAYDQGISDEFIPPTPLDHQAIQDGDVVWCLNFRADRARQICQALGRAGSTPFNADAPALHQLVSLTAYGEDTPTTVAYPKPNLSQTLGACLADAGLSQLRIAETEKYAHVTYFFNGGSEKPLPKETRTLIPSPKVSTYDLQPAMNVHAVTDAIVTNLEAHESDVIIANFANADMVGHTGDQAATQKAIESIDACLARLVKALQAAGGQCLITADHGNAEQMHDPQQSQAHTAHTTNPVPLVYVGSRRLSLADGELIDVAPTLLHLLGLGAPAAMTGHNLVKNL